MASAGFDQTVSLWDPENGRELVRCVGHHDDVRAVAFAPDGKTLLSGGTDGNIHLWEVPQPLPQSGPVAGKELQVLRADGPVSALAFSPQGQLLASSGGAGGISLWDFRTRKVVKKIEVSDSVHALAFAPDGTSLASNGERKTLCVWDLKTSTARMTNVDELISNLAFAPDGKAVAIGSFSSRVRLRDSATGQEMRDFPGHADAGRSGRLYGIAVAFAPDGKTLASGGGDGTIRLWDPATGKETARLEGHSNHVTAIAFSPDGKRLVSGGSDHTVRIWDVAAGKLAVGLDPGGAISGLNVAADGKTLAVVHSTGRLEWWDFVGRTRRPLPRELTSLQGRVRAAVFAPNGKTLAVGVAPGSLRLVDMATEKLTFVGDDGEGPLFPLAFTPDGGTVLGGYNHGIVRRDLFGARRQDAPACRFDALTCLAVSPDGRTLAGGGGAAAIRLWHADALEFDELPGHPGGLLAVTFGADGRTLASGGKDQLIRIWEIASGKERKRFGGHPGWVRALASSPDGKLLASGGTDGVVRLWDALTGREMAEFTGHRGAVNAVVFSPDGRQLLSGGADTSVLVWDVAGVPRQVRPDAVTFRKDELDDYWSRLGGNGPDALLAIQYLARAPAQTVPLLQSRVRPVDAARIERLLKDLDSDEFEARERATDELATLGQAAGRTLNEAFKQKISAEKRQRLKELLAKLESNEPAPEVLRAVRAVEVLEMIGSPEARKVVAALAAGAKDFELTVQAKAALGRMK